MRTAVIMQPTYLPWLGYFDLMDRSDIFVVLDSVQFDKRSWQQRNRIKTANGELWLTVPVLSKGKRDQKICDVLIDDTQDFERKHVQTIRNAYARAEGASQHIGGLENIFEGKYTKLAELNIQLIAWIRDKLGIKTRIVRSSALPVEGNRVDLLISICKAVDATHYLSAEGARAYIEENNKFQSESIQLHYHGYQHPIYQQLHGKFMSFLSVIDLIFNEQDQSLPILRSGRLSRAEVSS